VVSAARRYGTVRAGGGRGAFDEERDGQGSVRARASSTQHGGKEKGAVAVGASAMKEKALQSIAITRQRLQAVSIHTYQD